VRFMVLYQKGGINKTEADEVEILAEEEKR